MLKNFYRFVRPIAERNLYTAVRLSRPWLVLERLSLAFTQPIAIAMSFAPGLPSAALALTQDPRSLVKYAG